MNGYMYPSEIAITGCTGIGSVSQSPTGCGLVQAAWLNNFSFVLALAHAEGVNPLLRVSLAAGVGCGGRRLTGS